MYLNYLNASLSKKKKLGNGIMVYGIFEIIN